MAFSSAVRRRVTSAPLVVAIALALVWSSAIGAGAAAGWGPEQVIVPIDQSMAPLKVGIAPDGTSHAILYRGTDGLMFTTIRRPGGTWQAPQVLSTNTFYTSNLDLVFDAQSTAYLVYSEHDGSHFLVKFTSRPAGGNWRPPVQLSASGNHAIGVVLAVHADRTLTAAWGKHNGSHFIIQTRRRPVGGSWGATDSISEVGQSASVPQLAVDNDGRVTAVWLRYDGANQRVQAAQRGTSGGWGPASTLSAAGLPATSPSVAVDGSGAVYVTWTRYDGAHYIVQAGRKPRGGIWTLEAPALSAAGQNASGPLIEVDALGNATVVWGRPNGTHTIVQSAQRTAAGGWQPAVDLSADGASAVFHSLTMNQSGTVLVAWGRSNGTIGMPQVMRHARGGAWQGPANITSTTSVLISGVGFDARGNAIIGWYGNGGAGLTGAVAPYDGAGPLTRMNRPTAPFSLTAPEVRWKGTDVWSDVDDYRVRRRAAAPNGDFGALSVWLSATSSTARTFAGGTLGSTYCFSARGTDTRNLVGPYSGERCTALPLNDGALNAGTAWQHRSVASAYRGDLLAAARQGATVTSDQVKAKRIALVATRAPGAGAVDVFFAGDLVRTISLTPTAAQNPNSTYRKQVIKVAEFASRRSGVVRIVTRSDKPVLIEGLGVSAK